MKLFRRLSTARLLALVVSVVAAAAAASVGAIAAAGSSAQTPPPKRLDEALLDALRAPQPAGITARVRFTNHLLPSGALAGTGAPQGSALLSGGSGRLWWSPDGRGRLELQSSSGDAQILWDETKLTIWDSSSNTVYTLPLPSRRDGSTAKEAAPTLADVDALLGRLAGHVSLGAATPVSVAGQPAYTLTVSPARPAGLLGSLALAWDATHGVPLEVALSAKGQSTPALALTVTDIAFGPVSPSDLDVTPPASAKTVELGAAGAGGSESRGGSKVTGLAAVQAAVPFTLVAPDTLAGRARTSVRLLGGDRKAALVLYGSGPGGIVLVERAAGAATAGGPEAALPTVDVGSETAHELATQLGTVLFLERGDVSIVLAGSITAADAEAAARSLG